MKRIVFLTGSELRHTFVRKFLANSEGIEVAATICEGLQQSLSNKVASDANDSLRRKHVEARKNSEEDFFRNCAETTADNSNPVFIEKGAINAPEHVSRIVDLEPDLVVAYGCSIIREALLKEFSGRFLNVHLGLSPYYRGSGTNFWPLVNREPEYVGASFMHIDAGIDTGEVIHQMRARVLWGDTPSTIGNRLISDMVRIYRDIIVRFDDLQSMTPVPEPPTARLYKRRDFDEDSVRRLYENFEGGLVDDYLQTESERCGRVPIVENPLLQGQRS